MHLGGLFELTEVSLEMGIRFDGKEMLDVSDYRLGIIFCLSAGWLAVRKKPARPLGGVGGQVGW